MVADRRRGRLVCLVRRYGLWSLLGVFLFALAVAALPPRASADGPCCRMRLFGGRCSHRGYCPPPEEYGGTWYWMRSPEEEKRVVAALYNRYCIRCHGVDGRGVWDIPDVPDFTNARWQASRCDARLAEIILEGRGAVMPPFRGTLSLEEGCAMGRYLRTFVPGTQLSPPDYKAATGAEQSILETSMLHHPAFPLLPVRSSGRVFALPITLRTAVFLESHHALCNSSSDRGGVGIRQGVFRRGTNAEFRATGRLGKRRARLRTDGAKRGDIAAASRGHPDGNARDAELFVQSNTPAAARPADPPPNSPDADRMARLEKQIELQQKQMQVLERMIEVLNKQTQQQPVAPAAVEELQAKDATLGGSIPAGRPARPRGGRPDRPAQ